MKPVDWLALVLLAIAWFGLLGHLVDHWIGTIVAFAITVAVVALWVQNWRQSAARRKEP